MFYKMFPLIFKLFTSYGEEDIMKFGNRTGNVFYPTVIWSGMNSKLRDIFLPSMVLTTVLR